MTALVDAFVGTPTAHRFCRSKAVGENRSMVALHAQLTNSTLRRVLNDHRLKPVGWCDTG